MCYSCSMFIYNYTEVNLVNFLIFVLVLKIFCKMLSIFA